MTTALTRARGGATAHTRLGLAVDAALAGLEEAAPDLVEAFRAALPQATDVVARRLVGALHRERLLGGGDRPASGPPGPPGRWDGERLYLRHGPVPVRRHGFGRIEVTGPVDADPVELLGEIWHRDGEPGDQAGVAQDGAGPLAAELADAVVGLALGYARRPAHEAALRRLAGKCATGGPGHSGAEHGGAEHGSAGPGRARTRGAAPDLVDLAALLPADEQVALFERLATDGHNLHPCGRTRLGWSMADRLAHDLESPASAVGFVALRRDLHVGDDLAEPLAGYGLPAVPPTHLAHPVHAWQLARVIPERYADLLASGALRVLDHEPLPATPTAALRTLLLPPDRTGQRRYLKLSLDVQVTSTRRSISVASTRNGPTLSAVLHTALAAEPRVLLLTEVAGAAGDAGPGRDRDLAAIVRSGLSGRLVPGEVAVPGGALAAASPLSGRTVLDELVTRYAATVGRRADAAAALAFLAEYARLLLPPLMRLATTYGIGLEAHLQNSIPTFVAGVPHRLVLRDFAGLRLHVPRLRGAYGEVSLWPGSVIGTDAVDVMRAKLAYTALQAHLGELVVRLVESHRLDEAAAWRAVREVVDATYADLGRPEARDDHAFFTAPAVPHKALVRMRLKGAGDVYVPVHNPLAPTSERP